jgi:adenosylmethionine-8-amino-7-oxononanoate aminotransferase
MWKRKNINNYPIKPDIITVTKNGTATRSAMAGLFRLNKILSIFIGDANRL